MEQGVWQEIELLYQKFQKLGISEAVDYDKYYLYSLITHSTAIEGSTLTELDTQLLFDEGVTAKGKPLVHHLMNEDLKQAYELAKVESDSLVPITPAFLKRMNAMLMRTTGSVHSVMGGSFDSSKGEFRLCGVTAAHIIFRPGKTLADITKILSYQQVTTRAVAQTGGSGNEGEDDDKGSGGGSDGGGSGEAPDPAA